eukprot:TRINITY_DN5256_c0_g1_i1.p1 TRINITY_DN5256_c0_g1~~TRINITY_DN5256_c0_g1_i1.p1  ORF type:complete len:359 (-),score=60.68 TRINITY_DN5256_c0_g1_i1:408-1484(-)
MGLLSGALVGLLCLASALGCTYFEVQPGGDVPKLIANTMEWSVPSTAIGWAMHTHPIGEPAASICDGGQSFTSKVGWAGVQNAQYGNLSLNAMNEHGLAVSGHAFRSANPYLPKNATATICAIQVGEWGISQFQSVADLRVGLATTAVITIPHPTVSTPGFQFAFADATDSIVVDYKDGLLRIHNNTVGVLTNDPPFEWHLSNLDNYVGLSREWPSSGISPRDTEVGMVPSVMGHGLNLLGLPGDLSPPSRFIRAFYMKEYSLIANPPKNVSDSIIIATGILNAMHINKGLNARASGEEWEFTQFATLKVPAQRKFYFRTYENMQWRMLDLSTLDLSEHRVLKMSRGVVARDANHDFE